MEPVTAKYNSNLWIYRPATCHIAVKTRKGHALMRQVNRSCYNEGRSCCNKGRSCYYEGICRYVSILLINQSLIAVWCTFVHSFIPDIYIAPLQETYSEALSVPLRSKRNVLRSLQKEDMLFWGSKRSVRGSSLKVEGPITEKALRCLSAERARGTKSSPRAEEWRARREARSETGLHAGGLYFLHIKPWRLEKVAELNSAAPRRKRLVTTALE